MNKEFIYSRFTQKHGNKYIVMNNHTLYDFLCDIDTDHGRWQTVRELYQKGILKQKKVEPGYYCSDCGEHSAQKTKYCPHCGLYKENYND